jgi:hypothetical protein
MMAAGFGSPSTRRLGAPRGLWGDSEMLLVRANCPWSLLPPPVRQQDRTRGAEEMTNSFSKSLQAIGICFEACSRQGV